MLKVLGFAAALLILLILLIPLVLDANQFRPVLDAKLSGALGREVHVGNLKLALLTGGIEADDITIADDPKFSSSPFVRAQSLHVGVEIRPLIFSRTVNITAISLNRPEVTLVRSPSGDWNFAGIGKAPGEPRREQVDGGAADTPGANVTIASLSITDGRVTVIRGDQRVKRYVFDKVDITACSLAFSSVFPFSLTAALPGGGSTKLEGKAGPLNRADLSLTPFEATFGMARFDLIASGFMGPESGLAGLINLDCSLASDGKQARTKGRIHADRLQLAKGGVPAGRAIALDYSLDHDLRNQSGILSDTRVTCDRAIAHLSGRYDMRGDSIFLKMKLLGKGMPARDLEALLPAAGIILPRGASLHGGALSIDMDTEGPIESLTTTGNVDLSHARLAGFDLGSKVAKAASLAGINASPVTEIEKLASGLRLTSEGIRISNFTLTVPSLGQLAGDGIISPDHALEFRMLARLQAAGGIAGRLARLAGSDKLSVPFFIRGTASDPKFVPDVKGAAGSLLDALRRKDGKTGESSPEENPGKSWTPIH